MRFLKNLFVGILILRHVFPEADEADDWTEAVNTTQESDDWNSTHLDVEEVSKHNTPEDCYVLLYHYVLDVTTFKDHHPGGKDQISNQCGNSFNFTAIWNQEGKDEKNKEQEDSHNLLKLDGEPNEIIDIVNLIQFQTAGLLTIIGIIPDLTNEIADSNENEIFVPLADSLWPLINSLEFMIDFKSCGETCKEQLVETVVNVYEEANVDAVTQQIIGGAPYNIIYKSELLGCNCIVDGKSIDDSSILPFAYCSELGIGLVVTKFCFKMGIGVTDPNGDGRVLQALTGAGVIGIVALPNNTVSQNVNLEDIEGFGESCIDSNTNELNDDLCPDLQWCVHSIGRCRFQRGTDCECNSRYNIQSYEEGEIKESLITNCTKKCKYAGDIDQCLSREYECAFVYEVTPCECGHLNLNTISDLGTHLHSRLDLLKKPMKDIACIQNISKKLTDDADAECPNDDSIKSTPIICFPDCENIPIIGLGDNYDLEGPCCEVKVFNSIYSIILDHYPELLEEVGVVDLNAAIDPSTGLPSDLDSGARRLFQTLTEHAEIACYLEYDESLASPMRYCNQIDSQMIEIDLKHACETTNELKCHYNGNTNLCMNELKNVCDHDLLDELWDKCISCCYEQVRVTGNLLSTMMEDILEEDEKRQDNAHRIGNFISTDCSSGYGILQPSETNRYRCCANWCSHDAFAPNMSDVFDDWVVEKFQPFINERTRC